MRRHTDQAYLLRLWREGAASPLRATLTDVAAPHMRRHFTDLDALQHFLLEQTGPAAPSQSQEIQPKSAGDENHCTPNDR